MRRALILSTALLGACSFEVNVGSLDVLPPPDGGFGGGFIDPSVVCTSPQVVAYEITLAETVVPGNCWQSGDAGTLLEEQFTALLLTGATHRSSFASQNIQTISLHGLREVWLGDAPPIKPAQAFGGVDRTYTWFENQTIFERVGGPANARHASLTLSFDRLDTTLTSGVMTVNSWWECQPDTLGQCPAPLPFTLSCSYARQFVAQRTELREELLPPPVERIAGAQELLVSIDTGSLVPEGDYCWGSPGPRLVQREAPTERTIERWQYEVDRRLLHVPPRTISLGDAPPIQFGPDIPVGVVPDAVSVTTMTTPGATETSTTFVGVSSDECTLPGGLRFFAYPFIALKSSWSCTGAECSNVSTTTRGTCEPSALGYFAIPFGGLSVSP